MIYLVVILAVAFVASCAWNYSLRNKLQDKTSKNLELEIKASKLNSLVSNLLSYLLGITHILNELSPLNALDKYLSDKDLNAEIGSMSAEGQKAWSETRPMLKSLFKHLFVESFYQIPADTSLQVLIACFPVRWLDLPKFLEDYPSIKGKCLKILENEWKNVKSYQALESVVSLYKSWLPFQYWEDEIVTTVQTMALNFTKQEVIDLKVRITSSTDTESLDGGKFKEVADDTLLLVSILRRKLIREESLAKQKQQSVDAFEKAFKYLKPAVNSQEENELLGEIIKQHAELYSQKENTTQQTGEISAG